MRHEVGSTGRVYAFEPQPELAAFVRRVAHSFGWTNVHVEQAGLSSQPGERTLHVPGDKPSQRGSLVVERSGARRLAVRVDTLDHFLEAQETRERVALIKCDVEGHELELFQGAERVLRNDRPSLLFECEARFHPTGEVRHVFEYLEGLGYRGSFFWKGRLHPVRDFDLAVHQVEGRRPFANNFAFEVA